jgi:hypothetical protein
VAERPANGLQRGSAGGVAEARVERGGLRRRGTADLNAQQFAEFPVVTQRAGGLARGGELANRQSSSLGLA